VEKPSSGATKILKSARAAAHERFDRIAFEFSGGVPGYMVSYVDGVTSCGSGEKVTVEGGNQILITFSPAAAHDSAGKVTLDKRSDKPGLTAIREYATSCDHEGQVGIVLGVAAKAPFAVTELTDPPRIAIDVGH
jgi:hypothetical protein